MCINLFLQCYFDCCSFFIYWLVTIFCLGVIFSTTWCRRDEAIKYMSSIPEPRSAGDEERWAKVGEQAKRIDPGLRQVSIREYVRKRFSLPVNNKFQGSKSIYFSMSSGRDGFIKKYLLCYGRNGYVGRRDSKTSKPQNLHGKNFLRPKRWQYFLKRGLDK